MGFFSIKNLLDFKVDDIIFSSLFPALFVFLSSTTLSSSLTHIYHTTCTELRILSQVPIPANHIASFINNIDIRN